MKLLQKSCLMLALSLPILANANSTQTATINNTTQAQTISDDEAVAGFCEFAAYGSMHIAAARQADVPKSELINQHNQSMDELRSQMDALTSSTLDNYWKDAIEGLYQEPIQKTDDQKNEFVMAVGNYSFNHCLEQLLPKPTP